MALSGAADEFEEGGEREGYEGCVGGEGGYGFAEVAYCLNASIHIFQ